MSTVKQRKKIKQEICLLIENMSSQEIISTLNMLEVRLQRMAITFALQTVLLEKQQSLEKEEQNSVTNKKTNS